MGIPLKRQMAFHFGRACLWLSLINGSSKPHTFGAHNSTLYSEQGCDCKRLYSIPGYAEVILGGGDSHFLANRLYHAAEKITVTLS